MLLILLLRSRGQQESPLPQRTGHGTLAALAMTLIVTLAGYWSSLWFPFTADDYVLVTRALRNDLLRGAFTEGDAGVAFRPLTKMLIAVQGWSGDAGSAWWHSVGIVFHLVNCILVFLLALAVLTKESAYVFVPLAWLMLAATERAGWKGVRALLPFVILEAALFAYRWQVLGGLGGYVNHDTGQSAFLSFDVLRIVKTLLWRMWAILFFPVHWGVPTGRFLGASLILAAAALLVLARARANRRALVSFVFFAMVSLLPVLPFSLVGADLLGSRLYYLASVGFALLLAVALGGVEPRVLRAGAAAALLIFHFAALRHELRVWESVTGLAQRTCVAAAAPGSPALVGWLPDSIDGVFFLGNGFMECVDYYAGRRMGVQRTGRDGPAVPSGLVFGWDPKQRRLVVRQGSP
ncbi:MAG TPA: hypothetical protein VLH09_06710 [Bryobacteraceae bacterium]|nr:hypothetical protein [Bryobacteraceae bacterium]